MRFNWEKKGLLFNPTEVRDRYFINEFAQAPCTLVFEDFIRIYFSCRPKPDANGRYVSYSAYVDVNRKNLFEVISVAEQPVLKLGELGTFDEFGTYPFSVIEYGDQLLGYYAGWTRCESVPFNVAIGASISSDGGNTFEKLGAGPIVSYSPDEPFVLSGPKIRRFNGKFYLFYIAGKKWIMDNGRPEPVYRIRMATSDDGLTWHKHGKDLIKCRVEADEAQASPDVIFYEGKYHMFFCYRYSTGYRSHEKGYRIGYACSTDLVNWTRDDANAGIDVSADGWDAEMISYPHVFELDGEVYMLYLGNQVGRLGFGLAQLKK